VKTPIFAASYTHSVLAHDGTPQAFTLTSYALELWRKRLGCTPFRPNPVTGTVLTERGSGAGAAHCCVAEREAD
jgi:hypothetical protein